MRKIRKKRWLGKTKSKDLKAIKVILYFGIALANITVPSAYSRLEPELLCPIY